MFCCFQFLAFDIEFLIGFSLSLDSCLVDHKGLNDNNIKIVGGWLGGGWVKAEYYVEKCVTAFNKLKCHHHRSIDIRVQMQLFKFVFSYFLLVIVGPKQLQLCLQNIKLGIHLFICYPINLKLTAINDWKKTFLMSIKE